MRGKPKIMRMEELEDESGLCCMCAKNTGHALIQKGCHLVGQMASACCNSGLYHNSSFFVNYGKSENMDVSCNTCVMSCFGDYTA